MKRLESTLIFIVILLVLGSISLKMAMDNSILIDKTNEELLIKAVITHIKSKEAEEGKYVVSVRNTKDNKATLNIKENLMLKIIGDQNFDLGDEIVFRAILREPMKNTNPKLYNHKLNLLSNKIFTTTTIREDSIIAFKKNTEFKYKIRIDFRDRVTSTFNQYLNKENGSLMTSIVLGDYSYMEEEDLLKFRELGLAHILAVSGLHIGIISGFLIYFLSYLGLKRKYSSIITISVIWIYGYLIGFPPSLLRANIMLSVFLWAFLRAEYYDSLNTLFLAILISFIINPMTIFNLSFQLSFLATFSIIYFTPKIRNFLYFLGPKTSGTLSGLLAVHIVLFPVQAYYFNGISILGILSNIIIVPILSFSLILGMVMVVVSYFLPFINGFIGGILNFILYFQFVAVRLIHKIDFSIIKVHSPNIYEFIYYYLIILLLFKIIDLKDFDFKIKKLIFNFFIFSLILNIATISFDKSIEIHFIDVGQGDSIYIKSKEGNYLIDTGGNVLDGFDIGKNITLPYLEKLGVNTLEAVFISHFHEDHARSLPLLMDNIKIKNIFISQQDYNSPIFMEVIEKGVKTKLLKEGDRLVLNKNTTIDILSPNRSYIKDNFSENNLSLVFLLNYFDTKILFTGDMEKELEYKLLNKLNKIDIIKIPHHGSNTSSTKELLDIIRPEFGIISVGRNNFHNHPHKEVLERYKNIKTKVYRTDEDGMIKIILNRDKIEIIPFIKKG